MVEGVDCALWEILCSVKELNYYGRKMTDENFKFKQIYFDHDLNRSLTGNIYLGKVVNIIPSLQCAFIDIGLKKLGFLHLNEIRDKFSSSKKLKELDSISEYICSSILCS